MNDPMSTQDRCLLLAEDPDYAAAVIKELDETRVERDEARDEAEWLLDIARVALTSSRPLDQEELAAVFPDGYDADESQDARA